MTTLDPRSALLRGKHESWALRLLREGSTPRHVAETTGVPMDRLRELVAEQPPRPARCQEDRCGRPQEGPGHPRKGWVQTKVAGEQLRLWFCSRGCVVRHGRNQLGGAR